VVRGYAAGSPEALPKECKTMLRKLFGFGTPRRTKLPPRDVVELTRDLVKPGVRLLRASQSIDTPRSHLGGAPILPTSVPWPSKEGTPLDFLAQIDLAELQQEVALEWLPSNGKLLFFYDCELQPWGFDPKDRGGWAVLHTPGDSPAVGPTTRPAPARISLERTAIAFRRIDSFPSAGRTEIEELRLTDPELERYDELCDLPYRDRPWHQIGGYPAPEQSDAMELECQLASNGVSCGDVGTENDPRFVELSPGAADWRLLLQLDSDDDLGVMWGDLGRIYFFVREEDARAGRFQDAWLVLQCG
jgi:uncharacterized protein YwqG